MTAPSVSFETNSPFYIRVCLTLRSPALGQIRMDAECDGRKGFKASRRTNMESPPYQGFRIRKNRVLTPRSFEITFRSSMISDRFVKVDQPPAGRFVEYSTANPT